MSAPSGSAEPTEPAELEVALRTYEAALAGAGLGRHSRPDRDDDHLHRLRIDVVRLAEQQPSAGWPRPRCARCDGRREVDGLTAEYAQGSGGELAVQARPVRRLCPRCMGTGLMLRL